MLDKQKILKFLGYKLVRFAILLVVVILLSFILIDMSPINPVNAYISNMVVSPEKVAQLEAYWGVNQPITEKLLNWLGNIIVGDFGTSLIYRTPVLHVIGEKFTASLILMLTSWLISGVLGFTLGVLAGFRRDCFACCNGIQCLFRIVPCKWGSSYWSLESGCFILGLVKAFDLAGIHFEYFRCCINCIIHS